MLDEPDLRNPSRSQMERAASNWWEEVTTEIYGEERAVRMFHYQRHLARETLWSTWSGAGSTYTLEVARQGGKTEAVAALLTFAMYAFPSLFKRSRWSRGVRCGLAAPSPESLGIPLEKIADTVVSKTARETFPDVHVLTDNDKVLLLSNGSVLRKISASPSGVIEGKTLDLLCTTESQSIPDFRFKKDLLPMGSAVGGTRVYEGKPGLSFKNEFNQDCKFFYNRVKDGTRGTNLWIINWEEVGRLNPVYLKDALAMRKDLGESSPEWRTQYGLEWITESLLFCTDEQLARLANNLIHRMPAWKGQVGVGHDIGKAQSSTVVTVGCWWNGKKRILDWYEKFGDDHEKQWDDIMGNATLGITGFLPGYEIMIHVVDSRGPGSPVYDRLARHAKWRMHPINWDSRDQVDDVHQALMKSVQAGDWVIPNDTCEETVCRGDQYRHFKDQVTSAQKTYLGEKLKIAKPESKTARDDYVSSWALLNWGLDLCKGTRQADPAGELKSAGAEWITIDDSGNDGDPDPEAGRLKSFNLFGRDGDDRKFEPTWSEDE